MRLPKLFMILFWEESRKVCFGVTLFYVASYFLFEKMIDASIWMVSILLSTALIGGGTVADKFGGMILDRVFGNKDNGQPKA